MNSRILDIYKNITKQTIAVPTTDRGRALHTVSWFLHGSAQRNNVDLSQIRAMEVSHVNA